MSVLRPLGIETGRCVYIIKWCYGIRSVGVNVANTGGEFGCLVWRLNGPTEFGQNPNHSVDMDM